MGLLDKAKDKARHFKDETSGALADVAVAKLPGRARGSGVSYSLMMNA